MEQGSKEWLEMRRGKIGASDAPVIMGVSPWSTPFQLWQEKLGLRDPKKVTAAMQYGTDKEAEARAEFESLTGLKVSPIVKVHPDHEWMMASYDGMTEDGKSAVEIKHCGADDWACIEEGKAPEKYYPQLQHQIHVAGLDSTYYMARHRGKTKIITVERDGEYIADMLEKELAFWDCMQHFIAPPMSDRDIETRSDEGWCQMAQIWRQTKELLDSVEKRESELRKKLIAMAAGDNVQGGGVQVTGAPRKGVVDYKSIPEIQNINVEAYRKSPIMVYTLKCL